jgi:hypothetical protein
MEATASRGISQFILFNICRWDNHTKKAATDETCVTHRGGGGEDVRNVDKTLIGKREVTNYLGELGISGRKKYGS